MGRKIRIGILLCILASVAQTAWLARGRTSDWSFFNNQPRHPDGYAEPDADPLLPQRKAEIMAGRVPLSQTEAEIPASLGVCVIGTATAREINWLK